MTAPADTVTSEQRTTAITGIAGALGSHYRDQGAAELVEAAATVLALLADRSEQTEPARDAIRLLLGTPRIDRPRAAILDALADRDPDRVITDAQADQIVRFARARPANTTCIAATLQPGWLHESAGRRAAIHGLAMALAATITVHDETHGRT